MVRCQNYKHCMAEDKICSHKKEHPPRKYGEGETCTSVPCQHDRFLEYNYVCEDTFLLKVRERVENK